MLPKLVLTDIDGVWTDGGMYYDKDQGELKKFNTSDSAGVLFLKLLEIPFGIITGENTPIVQRRADKLNVKHLYLGIKNKVKVTEDLCAQLNISISDVAYIGDDINDMPLLKKVGFSACPDNAPQYVKDICDLKLPTKGGDGAFRHFVEHILMTNNLLDEALDKYFGQLNQFEQ